MKVEIAQLLRQGLLKEFLSERGKIVVDKGKRDNTLLRKTLRIMNTISGGSEISGLIVSTMSSYICRVNSVALEYELLDPEYKHSLKIFSHKVRRLKSPHDDPLVISLNVANVLLRQMLFDTGCSTNIIFLTALKEMRIENIKMENMQVSLVGLSGEQVSTVGTICLLVYVEGMNLMIKFMVYGSIIQPFGI